MKKYVISILIFIFFSELILRFIGVLKTYNEITNTEYIRKYRVKKDSWFHSWSKNQTIIHQQDEFKYTFRTNDFGHREKLSSEFLIDTSSIIICIGDSFTEGDGAPYDSTWVKKLEYNLNNECKKNYTIYNAGVSGSDVFYNYKMISENLIKLKPQIIIEALNTSDVYDFIFRGGEERFNEDGTTSYKVGPRWEFFYKNIYLFRAFTLIFTDFNNELINQKDFNEKSDLAVSKIKKQIEKTHSFCKNNNIKYYLIVHSVPAEIRNNNCENELYNLKESYIVDIQKDMCSFFTKNELKNYSWRLNGHYNSKGYFLMGDIIYKKLKKFICLN